MKHFYCKRMSCLIAIHSNDKEKDHVSCAFNINPTRCGDPIQLFTETNQALFLCKVITWNA